MQGKRERGKARPRGLVSTQCAATHLQPPCHVLVVPLVSAYDKQPFPVSHPSILINFICASRSRASAREGSRPCSSLALPFLEKHWTLQPLDGNNAHVSLHSPHSRSLLSSRFHDNSSWSFHDNFRACERIRSRKQEFNAKKEFQRDRRVGKKEGSFPIPSIIHDAESFRKLGPRAFSFEIALWTMQISGRVLMCRSMSHFWIPHSLNVNSRTCNLSSVTHTTVILPPYPCRIRRVDLARWKLDTVLGIRGNYKIRDSSRRLIKSRETSSWFRHKWNFSRLLSAERIVRCIVGYFQQFHNFMQARSYARAQWYARRVCYKSDRRN